MLLTLCWNILECEDAQIVNMTEDTLLCLLKYLQLFPVIDNFKLCIATVVSGGSLTDIIVRKNHPSKAGRFEVLSSSSPCVKVLSFILIQAWHWSTQAYRRRVEDRLLEELKTLEDTTTDWWHRLQQVEQTLTFCSFWAMVSQPLGPFLLNTSLVWTPKFMYTMVLSLLDKHVCLIKIDTLMGAIVSLTKSEDQNSCKTKSSTNYKSGYLPDQKHVWFQYKHYLYIYLLVLLMLMCTICMGSCGTGTEGSWSRGTGGLVSCCGFLCGCRCFLESSRLAEEVQEHLVEQWRVEQIWVSFWLPLDHSLGEWPWFI